MSANRPKISREMKIQAGLKIANACDIDDDRRREFAEDVADCAFGAFPDGFELGKSLDLRGWEVDASMVEELDCFGSYLRGIHEAACREWVEREGVQPPLPVGSMTTKGEITGICSHSAACYLVKPYGQDDEAACMQRLIVRFEDAHQVAQEEER